MGWDYGTLVLGRANPRIRDGLEMPSSAVCFTVHRPPRSEPTRWGGYVHADPELLVLVLLAFGPMEFQAYSKSLPKPTELHNEDWIVSW